MEVPGIWISGSFGYSRKLTVKPLIFDTTLLAIDTTLKSHLALRAIEKSLEQCEFPQVKLLTDNTTLKHAVKIPKIEGLGGYSKFCIRDMARFVDTPFALVVQADGYVLNGNAWTDEFLKYDYCGAPFNPSGIVGNGGFSLRSRNLMEAISRAWWDDCHSEDAAICIRHRAELERAGFKFAPLELAQRFAIEGRSWDSQEWKGTPNFWNGEFGFHSLLTPMPADKKPCKVFHHSGDYGDILYSLPVTKALGGGALFISTDNRYPHPKNSKWALAGGDPEWVNNIKPLLEAQSYIDRVSFTHGTPHSTDYDLNKFRLPWKERTAKDFHSIFRLHADAFNLTIPEDEPWLTVPDPVPSSNRSIAVNLTSRYRNEKTRWDLLVKRHHAQMIFVGTDQEAELFNGIAYPLKVPHYRTVNLLQAAQVIAGSKCFIGNQSACLAIAHGLGKNVIVEEWPQNANCHLERPNAIYWNEGEIQIPEGWL